LLLEPRFLERLERLSLGARQRLSGLYPGGHRSRRLGTSLDFADWRPYAPGDDFRRIDYQIYARLDRLVVRLYEAEEELNLRIVLDASQSMAFDGKLEAAARVAGALCYLAAARRDRARVWVVDSTGVRPSPWARSRDSGILLLDWLDSVVPAGASNLPAGLSRLAAGGGLPGLTVVLSDLMTEEWESAIRRLSGPGAEAAVLHVLSRSEIEPDLAGDVLLVDSEDDASVEVSASEQVLSQYRERASAFIGHVSEACRRRGIFYSLIDPDVDLESLILVDLRREGLVR
jgi:uncharacterized protein (DUF58 family)